MSNKTDTKGIERVVLLLLPVSLAFCGIYYEYLSCFLSIGMFFILWMLWKKDGKLTFQCSLEGIFFFALCVMSILSCIWAVDSHMAFWGFLKILPLSLFAAIMMQRGANIKATISFLPLIASVLLLISLIGAVIPFISTYFVVNGRLGGVFQYPNTFAAFLLISLIPILWMEKREKRDYAQLVILLTGILLTGSRSVYVLFVLVLIATFIFVKDSRKLIAALLILIAACIAVVLITGGSTLASRISSLSFSDSTFLGRVLYWKDALPVILSHPLGLGTFGYYFTQGGFQHGVYQVTYVHNEILQAFLDYGWLIGIGLCAIFIKGIIKAKSMMHRMMLFVLLLHALFDFDLQYIGMYMLLIVLLPWNGARERDIAYKGISLPSVVVASIFLVFFAFGNMTYYFNISSLAGIVHPSNTLQQIERINGTELTDEELVAESIEILDHNEHVKEALNILAQGYYLDGDVAKMAYFQEKAISSSRYSMEQYQIYLEMLDAARDLYEKQGDMESTAFCQERIERTWELIADLKKETDPIAWKINDKPEFDLLDEKI